MCLLVQRPRLFFERMFVYVLPLALTPACLLDRLFAGLSVACPRGSHVRLHGCMFVRKFECMFCRPLKCMLVSMFGSRCLHACLCLLVCIPAGVFTSMQMRKHGCILLLLDCMRYRLFCRLPARLVACMHASPFLPMTLHLLVFLYVCVFF